LVTIDRAAFFAQNNQKEPDSLSFKPLLPPPRSPKTPQHL
jgi:hypothetical protein